MPWARIDDLLPVHPKVRALTDAAFRLYISAICWCNLNITDGHVAADQLKYISDVRRSRQCADQLVEVGLWETTPGGWYIHDYLAYQPSAEAVKRERELKRQRQARWRARDASTDTSTEDSGDASTDTSLARARPHPIPSPGGSVGNQSSDRNGQAPDLILIKTVQQTLAERTHRTVSAEQALAIAVQIIGSETVRNPAAYVSTAISRDPNPRRFLPVALPPPPPRPRADPNQSQINARGRESARQMLSAALSETRTDAEESL